MQGTSADIDRTAGRKLSALDRMVIAADAALRSVGGRSASPARPSPAEHRADAPLDDADRRLAARLMRVNHSGEVAAQALYQGQATTARQSGVRRALRRAAREEQDHLVWCEERVRELGARPSA